MSKAVVCTDRQGEPGRGGRLGGGGGAAGRQLEVARQPGAAAEAAGQPGEHLQLAMRLQCVAGLPHLWPSLLGGITIMTHSVSLHHCLPTQSENFLELNHTQDYAIPPP